MTFYCVYLPHFVYPFICCCIFGLFPLLAIVNNVTMNICAQILYVFISLGYILLGLELIGHMVTLFNHLKNYQIVFQSGYTILHSYQQCRNFPLFLHLCQPLLLSDFFDYSHLSECEVVSHCGFDLYFPNEIILNIFSWIYCAYWLLVDVLWKKAYQILCSSLKWVLLSCHFIYFLK